jgi:hypothetical protein
MNLKRLINTSDLNWWLVLGGIGCDLILMVIVTWVGASLLRQGEAMVTASQVVLLLGSFLATFFTALLTGWIGQGNSTTYGLISSAGAVLIVLIAVPFGILTLLLVVTAVAGALNGGLISERRYRRRRR